MRRPPDDSRPARADAERPLVADGSAAADASQQPRPRGRGEAGGADRLWRLGQGGAEPRGAQGACPLPPGSRGGRDPARPERQAGRRLPHAPRCAARPPRELAPRPALGDLGGVPAARSARTDDVRADDCRELDLHRHPGNPPGHVPDLRRSRGEALRLARPEREDDPHGRAWRNGRRAAPRRDDGGRRDPLHRDRPSPDRAPARDAVPRRGCRLARRRARASACRGRRRTRAVGRAARQRGRARARAGGPRRALRFRHRSDRRARPPERLCAGGALRGGSRSSAG